jgi:hypothetical protein
MATAAAQNRASNRLGSALARHGFVASSSHHRHHQPVAASGSVQSAALRAGTSSGVPNASPLWVTAAAGELVESADGPPLREAGGKCRDAASS